VSTKTRNELLHCKVYLTVNIRKTDLIIETYKFPLFAV
jgi:hypothetical protein